MERATEIFIERGQTIAYENPEITREMLAAVEEVRKAGQCIVKRLIELYACKLFNVQKQNKQDMIYILRYICTKANLSP